MSLFRIGILGGSGFIGRRLVTQLAAHGHDVRIGDIAPSTSEVGSYSYCDVREPEQLLTFMRGCDVVYNLAAQHRDDVRPIELYEQVNLGGARNVCAAARKLGIQRMVFTSSVAVYGLPERPVDENAPCKPFNEYGATKLAAEHEYRQWASEDPQRSLRIVRPTVVFGEGNRGNVYQLAHQVARGRFVMVGDGKNRKSMAYVENVAGFLAHMLNSESGVETYNYADTPDFDMRELVSLMRSKTREGGGSTVRIPYAVGMAAGRAADLIARVASLELPISAVRVKKFCASTEILAQRVMQTGYVPSYTLEMGLQRFLQHEFGLDAGSRSIEGAQL